MRRRNFLLAGTATFLASCQMTEPVVVAESSSFSVSSVSIGIADPDALQGNLDRWNVGVTKEQFAEDVRRAVTRTLKASSQAGSRPVALRLILTRISLDSTIPGPLQISLISPIPYSTILSEVHVTDAQTGELLVRRNFLGDDNPGAHTFSSTVRASFSGGKEASRAYQDVVAGFADDLARQFAIGFDKVA